MTERAYSVQERGDSKYNIRSSRGRRRECFSSNDRAILFTLLLIYSVDHVPLERDVAAIASK